MLPSQSLSSFRGLLFHHPPLLCLLPAPSRQPQQDHLLICTPQGSHCPHRYNGDRGRKAGYRGRRKHHLWTSSSASSEGRTAQRRQLTPSTQIPARIRLHSWEGKSWASAFLTIFPPASSFSSFSAVGLFWSPKQVRHGLPWISHLH